MNNQRIFVAKEIFPGEQRVALLPASVEKLHKLGAVVTVQHGLGASLGIADEAYRNAGAELTPDATTGQANTDIILRLRKPTPAQLDGTPPGTLHVSYLDPFNDRDLLLSLASRSISAISLEMIPRTTIAQKMDVLSSQANLSGYVAVILAAERIAKILPMMTTPSGTIPPAKVFVIGVGVAGLQAIATAKRLGAIVDAFDTRPVVEEQVKSLGARFVKVDLGSTGQTKDGYAHALTDDQLAKQRQALAKHCAEADIVITTAQVFGRKAPVIVTRDMIDGMAPGSVIVDLAVETGGNVEHSRLNEELDLNGVRLIGLGNLPGRVALPASQMYSNNLVSFLDHFWDKKQNSFTLKTDDDIIKAALVTHGGKVVHEGLRKTLEI
jgi:NAD(P) transhydrogenase subunit alpha